MRRVLVMGCSGSGKSTFAKALALRAGLPCVSLDGLFWKPGWVEPDKADFGARVLREADRPNWIMDGNYTSHGGAERRLERADTVFWFDLPRWVCMTGVLLRIVSTYGRVRPEMAAGCPERLDLAFLRWVWNYRRNHRPKQLAYLGKMRPDQMLVTFTSRRQANAYLAGLDAAKAH